MSLTFDVIKAALPQILAAVPADWRGTTFANSNLLGRKVFSDNLAALILKKTTSGETISTEDLHSIGNAEDYLRVSTNISTTLELTLALQKGYDAVHQVFTFGSTTMPIVAVALTSGGKAVHLYTGDKADPFSEENHRTLKLVGITLESHTGAPSAHDDAIVLALDGDDATTPAAAGVDGTIGPNVLYIVNPDKIDESKILVIRKRMATPVTTPVAMEMLQRLAGTVPVTANQNKADEESVITFNAHLQTLSGTEVNTSCNPVSFTAGLPAICSLMTTLISTGGADILQCSTAYGGSSQLIDILNENAHTLNKHKFDIQGNTSMVDSIRNLFVDLAKDVDALLPTTVLFMEVPTNPDMKVPDMAAIAEIVRTYKAATKREVVLLVDATFAPGSQVMKKLRAIDDELVVIAFLSMSKSVSRGLTTAGALIANHTEAATSIINKVSSIASMLDTGVKPDQLVFLVENHTGVEDRCANAYKVAVAAGDTLRASVKEHNGADMPLAFVSPDQAALGFTTSTFSFNLPSPDGATDADNAGLAQKFVDLLTVHAAFKPCVSFGQDNGLVYATVPATSTQGAISEEDKGKQAVGGVQLVRLSFAPTCDVKEVCRILAESTAAVYAK
eukprot:TRINITY_DN3107_c0_g1_i1.p1 TRINITY_DN3107_c0_g1~~TRINITY_DN3107_c0_g1_i1.p1  ORF type:complete len:652 (-),score=157.58 TRINITY_DN3107_c0_g1_i1:279-2135(-)